MTQFDTVVPGRDLHRGLLVCAEFGHVEELAPTLLPADVEQCRRAGYEPRQAIYSMLLPAMNKFTFVAGARVAAMFGTCAKPGVHHLAEAGKKTPAGELWCFTGDAVRLAPYAWCEKFRFAVRELLGHYESLQARISVEHEQMIRLAQFVGGELEGPYPWGPKGRMFWQYRVR